MDYFLSYKNKETAEDIIEKTPPADLRKIKDYGTKRLSDTWNNQLIYGDNLPVLKRLSLDNSLKGKIRLVYIDPPFSTNNKFRWNEERTSTISVSKDDEIAYEDTLVGAKFLEFLRKRLIFLKEILADDGSIYVHIDCKKGHYVKLLMDEIFGENHFINDIARIKCSPKNFSRKGYGNIRDMVLFYSKSDEYVWNDSRVGYTEGDIIRLFPKVDSKGRRYTTTPLHAPGETKNGSSGMEWRGIMPPKGRHWRVSPDELTKLNDEGLIEWSSTGNPRKIIYFDEFIEKKKKRQDVWTFKDPMYPKYPTEKNLEMLEAIIGASSNEQDIVLDCFAGSGTTLEAAETLNRRWIGIDDSGRAVKMCVEKINNMKNHSSFGVFTSSDVSIEL